MTTPGPKAILLVEDRPADIYIVQQAVAACGNDFHLSIVPDGPAALAFLRKEPPFEAAPTPSLIILSLSLPKMNGTQLLRAIWRLATFHVTPLIVLGSASKARAERRCLRLGAAAYVEKILNFPVYCEAVKSLVQYWA
jgi:two-component system, chemotaxis family, response regulator Rcp1